MHLAGASVSYGHISSFSTVKPELAVTFISSQPVLSSHTECSQTLILY